MASSGTNSTTSSKVKLSYSANDSLIKKEPCLKKCSCCSTLQTQTSNGHESILNYDEYCDTNAFQIMKLINERKQRVRPSKIRSSYNKKACHYDLNEFNLFNSGGLVDIPKHCK